MAKDGPEVVVHCDVACGAQFTAQLTDRGDGTYVDERSEDLKEVFGWLTEDGYEICEDCRADIENGEWDDVFVHCGYPEDERHEPIALWLEKQLIATSNFKSAAEYQEHYFSEDT